MPIKLLNPKIDYVFKRIFGHVGNENITKNFLSCILQENITDITLDSNPILEKDLLDDKVGILDIKAKINNVTNIDIEMQIIDRKNIEKRILFYLSKMYSKSIKSGKDYNSLEKCIAILITDFEINVTRQIPQYITKWNIREEKYQQIILTDVMEIVIIELKKFKEYKEKSNLKTLNSWIEFIECPEVIDMSNKEIQKAKEVLEEISQDEHEQYLAELREKYIMDQKAIEDAGYDKGLKTGRDQGVKQGIKQGIEQGIKQGIEQGIKQGIEQGIKQGIEQGIKQGIKQGIEQGKKENSLQTAKKMLAKKIDTNTISEITGLTVEELKKL